MVPLVYFVPHQIGLFRLAFDITAASIMSVFRSHPETIKQRTNRRNKPCGCWGLYLDPELIDCLFNMLGMPVRLPFRLNVFGLVQSMGL